MRESQWLAPGVYMSPPSVPATTLRGDELGLEDVRVTSYGVYPSAIRRLPAWLRRTVSGALAGLDGGPVAAR
jgi:hypothetical protein